MDEHTNHQGAAMTAPDFRIWLCGTFRVERRVGVSYEAIRTVEWGGSSYPRLLLKALLCCSGRQARREALMALLWPECELEQAVQNLNTATSKLRNVLRLTKEQESLLLTENDATMYRLPGQELLWVDADAAMDLLKQAERLERSSAETLALLEEAEGYFRQGLFQQDEEGQWIAGRRATVEQVRYQCRLWLAEAYALQNMPGQAATMLSMMLEEDPFDEDVLCRLMVLLHRQGMTHQAIRLYKHSCQLFAEEGIEPSEGTNQVAAQLSMARYDTTRAYEDDMQVTATSSVHLHQSLRQALTLTYHELEREKSPIMDPTRRATIVGILRLLGGSEASLEWWEHLWHDRPSPMKIEAITHFQQIIENGWRLCNAGEWDIAEQVLDSFLSDAIRHASLQREAAVLASRGLVLRSILQAHQLKLTTMIPLCQQAVLFAKSTQDHTVLCASLNGLAVAFKYNRRPEESFQTYLEAISYCDGQASPLVRSRIYAGAAAAFAQRGRKQEADLYIHLAYEIFPDHPEHDPHVLSADHGWYMNAYYHGLMCLAFQQPHEALQAFEQYQERVLPSAVPQRNYLEIVNHQSRAAIMSGALEIYAACLKEGIAGAIELKSKKRLNEVVKIFQEDIPNSWRGDKQITSIIEQYPLLLEKAT